MIVYRITLAKWANELHASGYMARWNSKGTFVIYTAGSRALACLENIVHRSGEGLNSVFKVMLIKFPDTIKIEEIKSEDLPKNWYKIGVNQHSQKIGDNWVKEGKTAILKVPSAIIKKEYNYILNPNHKDYKKIKLIDIEDFDFDPRLKES